MATTTVVVPRSRQPGGPGRPRPGGQGCIQQFNINHARKCWWSNLLHSFKHIP